MAKGENIEKPKKKTGLVLIIATGAKPKKDSVKKAEEPRKPRKRGRGRERAQKHAFQQKLRDNPFHLDDTLIRMKLPKEHFEDYLKQKHNMSLDDALANTDLNIPKLLNGAKSTYMDMENLHPNLLRLLDKRGIDVSEFQRDYKKDPFMDFNERINTLAQRSADDRAENKDANTRERAAAKQFKGGTVAGGLKSEKLQELLERKGISVREFYDSYMDKQTPLDLPFNDRIDRLATKSRNAMPEFKTNLPDHYIPPSQQDRIDRDAEEDARTQELNEREDGDGIDEGLLRFYLNLYSHHRNPMDEAMKAIRAQQSGQGLGRAGDGAREMAKPEFPTLYDTDKQSDMFAHYKTGGPVHLQPSTEFMIPHQESSVPTPQESGTDIPLEELREFESYRRSEDKTSPIDAAVALLKSYSGSQRGNCDITRDDPLTGKSYGCKLFKGHDGPCQLDTSEEVQVPPIPDEHLNENPFANPPQP